MQRNTTTLSVEIYDSYGDGWNSGSLTPSVRITDHTDESVVL